MEDVEDIAEKTVWLVTGAGRGMGVDIARAALAAGHAVVATGRDPEKVTEAVGESGDLLTVQLDVTDPAGAQAAVQAAVDRFGRIDVLVNNAANFYAGFFEEISPDDFRAQVETNLFGSLDVTRAVLSVMRKQRYGLILTISSTAGLIGQEFCTAYAASKFAVEGLGGSTAPFPLRWTDVGAAHYSCPYVEWSGACSADRSVSRESVGPDGVVTAWDPCMGVLTEPPTRGGREPRLLFVPSGTSKP
jgi:NAD(P)-dependent dehydrogenase (short-subunit alcohol dehydrogenase family)